MIFYTTLDFIFIIATSLALFGVISIGAGILILVSRASDKAVQTWLARRPPGPKGITEEISGLVGNASTLVEALNQLVRTSAGIGIFLVMFGFVMLVRILDRENVLTEASTPSKELFYGVNGFLPYNQREYSRTGDRSGGYCTQAGSFGLASLQAPDF